MNPFLFYIFAKMENIRWFISEEYSDELSGLETTSGYILLGLDKNILTYALASYTPYCAPVDKWGYHDFFNWDEIESWKSMRIYYQTGLHFRRFVKINNPNKHLHYVEDSDYDYYAIIESCFDVETFLKFKEIKYEALSIYILDALKNYKNEIEPKIREILANYILDKCPISKN